MLNCINFCKAPGEHPRKAGATPCWKLPERPKACRLISRTTTTITCTVRPDDEAAVRRHGLVVMEERGIADALTSDHHFKQAGFRVLMA